MPWLKNNSPAAHRNRKPALQMYLKYRTEENLNAYKTIRNETNRVILK